MNQTPQSLETERAVLASCIINADARDIALESISEQDFYNTAHQRIYACIRQLDTQGHTIDLITLSEALRARNWAESIGGDPYLAELTESVYSSKNIADHCAILRSKSLLRQIILMAAQTQTNACEPSADGTAVLEQAEHTLFQIGESIANGTTFRIADILGPVIKDIDNRITHGYTGISTGYGEIDELIGGFTPGELIIIAGRPGHGKSALALCLAINICQQQKTVALFSLEMSKTQLVERAICNIAEINGALLRAGRLPKTQYPKMSMSIGTIAEIPLYIDDTATTTVLQIWAKCRRLKRQHGLSLIIVDYLQLITSARNRDNSTEEITDISRMLKLMAKDLLLPVIALSQLSRDVEKRGGERKPVLSDLRQSGAIEQDADIVMFTHLPYKYTKEQQDKEIGNIIIGKNREGATGDLALRWFDWCTKFTSPNNDSDWGEEKQEPWHQK